MKLRSLLRRSSPDRRIGPAACTGLAALGLLGSCVSSGGDVALAPLYTRVSSAGGGTATEALFGAVVAARAEPGGPVETWAVRPLYSWRRHPDGEPGPPPAANARWRADWLYPLGRATSGVRTSSSWFLPLYLWRSRETAHAGRRSTLLALPGIWWAKDEAGGGSLAWFPFYGHVEDFLTYEDIRFFLFPLWSSAERDGKRSQHFLFPVLGWTRGGGESSFRLWPLYVHSEIEGFHDRTSVLWPFFHWQTNDLHRGPGSTERKWMAWPLLGRSSRGTYRSTTVLWPFFGWASDPRADFWALDAPWPLVRVQSGGKNPLAEKRVRLWPFYSSFATEGLRWRSYAWPFVHVRAEESDDSRRDSVYVFPFWQSFEREDADGGRGSWWKLWPLAQRRVEDGRTRLALLAPFPFHWDSIFDFTWAWPLELWVVEGAPEEDVRRERAWGGLWRRERDAYEDRRHLSGLFSRRTYRDGGRLVRETSLLFGLLRWRSMEGAGTELLVPALPGPGWPAERSREPLDPRPTATDATP